jgi:hypothetical protein
MPAIYQLLPRPRHNRVIDEETGESVNFYDPAVWERYGWGLADPNEADELRDLLPDVESDAARRRIALEHLRKCLARAEQLHRALDVPAAPPEGLTLRLIAGDSVNTAAVLSVRPRDGRVRISAFAPGDGTVTRASALMDERVGNGYQKRLRTPIAWRDILFLQTDHLGLTKHPGFTDHVLFWLLEAPDEATSPAKG